MPTEETPPQDTTFDKIAGTVKVGDKVIGRFTLAKPIDDKDGHVEVADFEPAGEGDDEKANDRAFTGACSSRTPMWLQVDEGGSGLFYVAYDNGHTFKRIDPPKDAKAPPAAETQPSVSEKAAEPAKEEEWKAPDYPAIHPIMNPRAERGGPGNPIPPPAFSRVAQVFSSIAPAMTDDEKEQAILLFLDDQRIEPTTEERTTSHSYKASGGLVTAASAVLERRGMTEKFARFLNAQKKK